MWSSDFKAGHTTALLGLLQSVVPPLVCVGVLFASTQALGIPFTAPYFILAVIAALLCALIVPPSLADPQNTFSSGWAVASQIAIAWSVVVAVLLLAGYAIKISAFFSRLALFTWFILTPVVMVAVSVLLRKWAIRRLLAAGQARTAVVCGVNRASLRLIQSMRERPELGLQFTGLFDDRSAERLGYRPVADLLGRFSDMGPYVKEHRIDAIFIATPFSHLERTEKLLTDLQDTTASIYYVPDVFVFDLIQSRTTDLNGIPVVALRDTPFAGWRGLVKRASDVVLASLMILVASPLMLLIALGVKLTSPGSVIFRQRRYGLDGEEIIVWKFRTMTASDDGSTVEQARRDDPRVTPIGRFLRKYSLDELPQLFNVLQGRMSVVGPRPHAVAHNEAYRRVITGYMVRHKVTPGITGLAQVNGCRGETATVEDMQRRVEFDLQYLRQWSLALDLKILLKTFLVWFRDDKAY
ncbi:MAG: undecaprenyl-phosphate glucose phosphotransferase [Gammaproteobacteria bacterium]|nr:MAG: undecaprenyl-phosphate glucose phosphotransferase [Gammaproteobacteria bacterium]